MSRTNIPSNNLSSTETITDSLREIFITEDDTFSDISYESLSTEEAPELGHAGADVGARGGGGGVDRPAPLT